MMQVPKCNRVHWDGCPIAKNQPNYPDMPKTGLFAIIRQPIYLSFALTLWTFPFGPQISWCCHHSNGLLRVGPKVQGTAISGPFWCRVRTLSRPDTLYAAAYSGHKERLTVSSLFDLM